MIHEIPATLLTSAGVITVLSGEFGRRQQRPAPVVPFLEPTMDGGEEEGAEGVEEAAGPPEQQQPCSLGYAW